MTALPSIETLNQWCQNHSIRVRFLAISCHSPRLINEGYLPLDALSLTLAKAIQTTLKVDEWHALVDTQRANIASVMHYQVVRYSEMLALRQQGKMPTGLAATALPFSQESNSVLLQKRSVSSHLFPGFLSLLGGGFNPNFKQLPQNKIDNSSVQLVGDNDNPIATAQREVLEESGLCLTIPASTLVTITQETDNGAVQINYLGVPANFTGAHADEEEGLLVELQVPSLASVAALENTTDLLKANLIAWQLASKRGGHPSKDDQA